MPSGHCSTNIAILLLSTLLKNRRSFFESLRTNGDKVEMIDNVSFMLSLSQNSELFQNLLIRCVVTLSGWIRLTRCKLLVTQA